VTTSSTIDAGAIDRLREWGGAPLVGQMIRLFLKNAGQRVDQIRAGLADGAIREAEMGAHSLKSSAANLGAEQVRRLASDIERHAAAAERDSVAALLPALERAFREAVAELESIERELTE